MARDRRKKGRNTDRDDAAPDKPSESSFKAFLKKRAPIYLGLVALFLVFVIPELTKAGLDDVLPELAEDDQRVVDVLMSYNGPDGSGFTMAEAISDKITEEFGDEIYGHRGTSTEISVSLAKGAAAYDVSLKVHTREGDLEYVWEVDTDSGRVTSGDPASKHIVDIVNFYD